MHTSPQYVITSVLLLAATGSGVADDETYRYGPVEGYVIDVPVPPGTTSAIVSVIPDLPLSDVYATVCLLSEAEAADSRGCPSDGSNPRAEGCGLFSLSFLGVDEERVLRVALNIILFIEGSTGATCLNSGSGTVFVDLD